MDGANKSRKVKVTNGNSKIESNPTTQKQTEALHLTNNSRYQIMDSYAVLNITHEIYKIEYQHKFTVTHRPT